MSVTKSKRHPLMFEPPIALIGKLLLPPLLIWAWIVNLDSIKSTILFIFTLLFGMVQAFFWIKRAVHNKRMRELDLKEREREIRANRSLEEEEFDEY